MSDIDLTFVDQAIGRLGRKPEAVIPILQALQTHYRYLPQQALQRVCELTEIKPASVAGVSSFYTQFRQRPVGRHVIGVCHGTACHVKGAALIQDALEYHLKIKPGEDTDPDGLFTIEKVACLGCCTLAPVIQIDDTPYGRLSARTVPGALEDFLKQEAEGAARAVRPRRLPSGKPYAELRIGEGSCCVAQGSGRVHRALEEALAQTGGQAVVKCVGCSGMCYQVPLLELVSPDKKTSEFFYKVDADRARALVRDRFKPHGMVRRIGYSVGRWLDRLSAGEAAESPERFTFDVRDPPICAFFGPQKRIATEFSGEINPLDLEEYLRRGGFQSLQRCLEQLAPEQIIATVQQSGLRGRGGAGFPTGIKWDKVRAAAGAAKYVICNGDEGDPGAFMDRMILESFPYRVLEGMLIAARAVGADEGYLYIRAEYPLAVSRIRDALDACRKRGLLGKGIQGSDFHLELKVMEGAGAFICGEETALLASIEGNRGMPRLRPPFPAESGLWGKPTLINNVETFAMIPWIIREGAAAFAALGTEKSKGTKVFALAGKIRRGGLLEVPMGITVRQIVEDIGGGVAEGRRFKAVQIGGPSGGCLPESLADTPVDYEALAAVGAIMGSGGMVVLDDSDCMVDIARYFLRFTQDQSCGKCTFCRVGTRRMLDILDRICTGHGRARDLQELEDLSRAVGAGSLCGLGKTAPNPVLTTLRYFREEYEAHLAGRCPAGRCKELISYKINQDCIGCTICAQQCPADAIPLTPYVKHHVEMDKCTRCDTCRVVCPEHAVFVE